MDDFNELMRDITDRYLSIMGLPPLKSNAELRANSASNSGALSCVTDNSALAPFQYPEIGSPLWERLRVKPVEFHDHRDYPQRDRPDWDMDARGNPLKPGT